MMKLDPVIFREYDVRGIYNEQFDLAFVDKLGRAFATLLHHKIGAEPLVVVGRDARISGPEIVEALTAGLIAAGANVRNIGLVTTPMTYYATFQDPGVAGAIMVTGSHNPPEYNGFKICVQNRSLYGEGIQDLKRVVEIGNYQKGNGSEVKYDIFTPYIAHHAQEFGHLKDLPIVLDCGSGAAGVVARKFFNSIGLNPTILFEEPDGRFPFHHPDPTVEENLVDLKREVVRRGAICGIGFDGDADRIGLVDHTGKMILGDEILALISQFIIPLYPNAPIVGDVKCSNRLFDFIRMKGGRPVMWKTGHSLIKEKIRTDKSPFGGEMSGHIFFADRNFGYDDAIYAAARICEILSKSGQTIPELLKDLPPSFCTPEIRIDTTEDKKHQIVAALMRHFTEKLPPENINKIDGLRVTFPNGWALARPSNTQPVLVLRFEANSSEGLVKIKREFENIVNPLLV